MATRLLLVEDNPADVLHLQHTLDKDYPGQFETTVAATLGEAKRLLARQAFAAAILDLSLPDSQGLGTIKKVAMAAPNLPIVVLTGVVDADIVPEAVRCGAQDYLIKGQSDGQTIARLIRYAVDRKQAEGQLRAQQRELEAKNKELRDAQRRLEAYRNRYIDLYDFAPLGYVTLDEDGYVQESNLAAAQLLGTDQETLTGFPFSDYLVREDVPVLLDLVRKCVEERREVCSELRLSARDGRVVVAQLRSIPVECSEDNVTFCKTAITDITHRKEMEEMLRRSHAFLQVVIDAIPDPVMVIGRDYRIALANRAARELTGIVEIASGCLPCYQVSHGRDAPCEGECDPCPLREVIDARAPVTVTHTHYDDHGRAVFVEITAAPVFDEDGTVTHIIESWRDITDRRQAEEELKAARDSAERARAAAEEANRAKDDFLAVLGRELHAPLEPVVTGVSTLCDRPDLDPAMRETLELIRRNVEKEARLIDDLLDAKRVS